MTKQGQIYKRDAFLSNLANKLNRPRRSENVTKPTWEHQPQWEILKNATQDELVDVLKKQCEVIHTEFIETDTANLSKQIHHVINRYSAKSVITWDDERFSQFGLQHLLHEQCPKDGVDVHVWDSNKTKENLMAAEKSDIGITFSDITLAESGTVVLFSDNNKGRSVSLLPTTYLAIIPKSTIVPRMTQATAEISKQIQEGENVASCVNFITGPSNSADIELNLVVGVHGPMKATYIIVNDK